MYNEGKASDLWGFEQATKTYINPDTGRVSARNDDEDEFINRNISDNIGYMQKLYDSGALPVAPSGYDASEEDVVKDISKQLFGVDVDDEYLGFSSIQDAEVAKRPVKGRSEFVNLFHMALNDPEQPTVLIPHWNEEKGEWRVGETIPIDEGFTNYDYARQQFLNGIRAGLGVRVESPYKKGIDAKVGVMQNLVGKVGGKAGEKLSQNLDKIKEASDKAWSYDDSRFHRLKPNTHYQALRDRPLEEGESEFYNRYGDVNNYDARQELYDAGSVYGEFMKMDARRRDVPVVPIVENGEVKYLKADPETLRAYDKRSQEEGLDVKGVTTLITKGVEMDNGEVFPIRLSFQVIHGDEDETIKKILAKGEQTGGIISQKEANELGWDNQSIYEKLQEVKNVREMRVADYRDEMARKGDIGIGEYFGLSKTYTGETLTEQNENASVGRQILNFFNAKLNPIGSHLTEGGSAVARLFGGDKQGAENLRKQGGLTTWQQIQTGIYTDDVDTQIAMLQERALNEAKVAQEIGERGTTFWADAAMATIDSTRLAGEMAIVNTLVPGAGAATKLGKVAHAAGGAAAFSAAYADEKYKNNIANLYSYNPATESLELSKKGMESTEALFKSFAGGALEYLGEMFTVQALSALGKGALKAVGAKSVLKPSQAMHIAEDVARGSGRTTAAQIARKIASNPNPGVVSKIKQLTGRDLSLAGIIHESWTEEAVPGAIGAFFNLDNQGEGGFGDAWNAIVEATKMAPAMAVSVAVQGAGTNMLVRGAAGLYNTGVSKKDMVKALEGLGYSKEQLKGMSKEELNDYFYEKMSNVKLDSLYSEESLNKKSDAELDDLLNRYGAVADGVDTSVLSREQKLSMLRNYISQAGGNVLMDGAIHDINRAVTRAVMAGQDHDSVLRALDVDILDTGNSLQNWLHFNETDSEVVQQIALLRSLAGSRLYHNNIFGLFCNMQANALEKELSADAYRSLKEFEANYTNSDVDFHNPNGEGRAASTFVFDANNISRPEKGQKAVYTDSDSGIEIQVEHTVGGWAYRVVPTEKSGYNEFDMELAKMGMKPRQMKLPHGEKTFFGSIQEAVDFANKLSSWHNTATMRLINKASLAQRAFEHFRGEGANVVVVDNYESMDEADQTIMFNEVVGETVSEARPNGDITSAFNMMEQADGWTSPEGRTFLFVDNLEDVYQIELLARHEATHQGLLEAFSLDPELRNEAMKELGETGKLPKEFFDVDLSDPREVEERLADLAEVMHKEPGLWETIKGAFQRASLNNSELGKAISEGNIQKILFRAFNARFTKGATGAQGTAQQQETSTSSEEKAQTSQESTMGSTESTDAGFNPMNAEGDAKRKSNIPEVPVEEEEEAPKPKKAPVKEETTTTTYDVTSEEYFNPNEGESLEDYDARVNEVIREKMLDDVSQYSNEEAKARYNARLKHFMDLKHKHFGQQQSYSKEDATTSTIDDKGTQSKNEDEAPKQEAPKQEAPKQKGTSKQKGTPKQKETPKQEPKIQPVKETPVQEESDSVKFTKKTKASAPEKPLEESKTKQETKAEQPKEHPGITKARELVRTAITNGDYRSRKKYIELRKKLNEIKKVILEDMDSDEWADVISVPYAWTDQNSPMASMKDVFVRENLYEAFVRVVEEEERAESHASITKDYPSQKDIPGGPRKNRAEIIDNKKDNTIVITGKGINFNEIKELIEVIYTPPKNTISLTTGLEKTGFPSGILIKKADQIIPYGTAVDLVYTIFSGDEDFDTQVEASTLYKDGDTDRLFVVQESILETTPQPEQTQAKESNSEQVESIELGGNFIAPNTFYSDELKPLNGIDDITAPEAQEQILSRLPYAEAVLARAKNLERASGGAHTSESEQLRYEFEAYAETVQDLPDSPEKQRVWQELNDIASGKKLQRFIEEQTGSAPKAEKPKVEKPKAEKPKAEKPKAEKTKAETPKTETPKVETPKAEKATAPSTTTETPKQEPQAQVPHTFETSGKVSDDFMNILDELMDIADGLNGDASNAEGRFRIRTKPQGRFRMRDGENISPEDIVKFTTVGAKLLVAYAKTAKNPTFEDFMKVVANASQSKGKRVFDVIKQIAPTLWYHQGLTNRTFGLVTHEEARSITENIEKMAFPTSQENDTIKTESEGQNVHIDGGLSSSQNGRSDNRLGIQNVPGTRGVSSGTSRGSNQKASSGGTGGHGSGRGSVLPTRLANEQPTSTSGNVSTGDDGRNDTGSVAAKRDAQGSQDGRGAGVREPVRDNATLQTNASSGQRSSDQSQGDSVDTRGQSSTGKSQVSSDEKPHNLKPQNYIIPEDGGGIGKAKSNKARARANIRALQIAKQLEEEGRFATEEEQREMSLYSGWGNLSQVFDEANEDFTEEFNELKNLLTEDEYSGARRSTQYAHYTPIQTIRGVYAALEHLGLKNEKDARAFEAGTGIGHFIGALPAGLQSASYAGVEVDPISHKIAKHLYPNADLRLMGYQNYRVSPTNDFVVGNPPFSSTTLHDPTSKAYNGMSMHNHFIAKQIDSLRPGGVGAFVVTHNFLDVRNPSTREYINKKAKFLGYIRLPSSTFKDIANTNIVCDIVFFRKLMPNEKHEEDAEWVKSTTIPVAYHAYQTKKGTESVSINLHVANNRTGLGVHNLSIESDQFGKPRLFIEGDPLNMDDIRSLAQLVLQPDAYVSRAELAKLEKNTPENNPNQDELIDGKPIPNGIRHPSLLAGGYYINENGNLCVSRQGIGDELLGKPCEEYNKAKEEADHMARNKGNAKPRKFDRWRDTPNASSKFTPKEMETIKAAVKLRNIRFDLVTLELSPDAKEETIEAKRKELNEAYDEFRKVSGKFLNSTSIRKLLFADPAVSQIQGLEKDYQPQTNVITTIDNPNRKSDADPETIEKKVKVFESAQKSDIFFKRVNTPSVTLPTHYDDVGDALNVSINTFGRVDMEWMKDVTGKTEDDILADLKGRVFKDVETGEFISREVYLSGDVKTKLKQALNYKEANPQDPSVDTNIEELKKVIPEDIPTADISIPFGSPFIDVAIYKQFLKDEVGFISVHDLFLMIDRNGNWDFKVKSPESKKAALSKYPYPKSKIEEAVEKALNNKTANITTTLEDGKKVTNVKETELANNIISSIRDKWEAWWSSDSEISKTLAQKYNDVYNRTAEAKYDGSVLKFEGINVNLHPHQKNAVLRTILTRRVLFNHVVGAGKTLATVASVMEMKRMGIVNKPIIVVPNHLTLSWRDEFLKAYPSANVLAAAPEDFNAINRKRFFSRIQNGSYDAIVIPHSQLGKLSLSPNVIETLMKRELISLRVAILEAKAAENKRNVKNIEESIQKLEEKMKKKIEAAKADGIGIYLDTLGVDAFVLDESHEFKNVPFTSSINVAGMGAPKGSVKAFDLLMKMRYFQKYRPSSPVMFLTGTPIANSLTELYLNMKLIAPDLLTRMGVSSMDSFLKTFGDITTDFELDATNRMKEKRRLRQLINVGEIMTVVREYMDVVDSDDVEARVPTLTGGKPINVVAKRSPEQANFFGEVVSRKEVGNGNIVEIWTPGSLAYRAESIATKKIDPKVDNMLKITSDGRAASLDIRLKVPKAPDFAGSKVNMAIDTIVDNYNKYNDVKGTQLVFCDLSIPGRERGSVKKALNEMIEKREKLQARAEKAEESGDLLDDIFVSVKKEDGSSDEMAIYDAIDYYDEAIEQAEEDLNYAHSVYDDVKAKLIAKGIPANEIAFIHSAHTDRQKSHLFAEVNSGKVRILMGSTAKMGAGTNVQERIVALHHLDTPWRPADMTQRNGRAIRQGNKLLDQIKDFSVSIYQYATEQTADAYKYQTLESKSKAFDAIYKADHTVRQIEDFGDGAMSAEEMKAAASGSTLMLKRVDIEKKAKKLDRDSRVFYDKRNNIEEEFETFVYLANREEQKIQRLTDFKAQVTEKPQTVEEVVETTEIAPEEEKKEDSKGKKKKEKKSQYEGISVKAFEESLSTPPSEDELRKYKTDSERQKANVPSILDTILSAGVVTDTGLKTTSNLAPVPISISYRGVVWIPFKDTLSAKIMFNAYEKLVDDIRAYPQNKVRLFAQTSQMGATDTLFNEDGTKRASDDSRIIQRLDNVIDNIDKNIELSEKEFTLRRKEADLYKSQLEKMPKEFPQADELYKAKIERQDIFDCVTHGRKNAEEARDYLREYKYKGKKLPDYDWLKDDKSSESQGRFRTRAGRDGKSNNEYNEVVARYTNSNGTKKKGWLKAPNGKPTNLSEQQWVLVRTPSFKKWFGDWENDPENASKVVDENGEPMVVYHGSEARTFHTFQPSFAIGWGTGSYFASKKESAEEYGNVRAFFLNIRDPYIAGEDKSSTRFWEDIENTKVYKKAVEEYQAEFLEEHGYVDEDDLPDLDYLYDEEVGFVNDVIRERGFDGIIGDRTNNIEGFEIVAFNPNQIKSADFETFDDSGNLIPLNERFNLSKGDSRFRIRDKETEQERKVSLDEYIKARKDARPQSTPRKIINNVKDFVKTRDGESRAEYVARRSKEALDWLNEAFHDYLTPIRNLQKEVAGENIPEEFDIAKAAQLSFGRVHASHMAIEQMYIEPIRELLAKYDIELEVLDTYLTAMFAPERNAMIEERTKYGRGPANETGAGISNEEAAELIEQIKARLTKKQFTALETAASKVWELNRKTVSDLQSSGIISEETAAAWLEGSPHYVPLRDDLDRLGLREDAKTNTLGKPFQSAVGRFTKTIDSQLAFSLLQAQACVMLAEQNRINQTALAFCANYEAPLDADGNPQWYVSRGPKRAKRLVLERKGFRMDDAMPLNLNNPAEAEQATAFAKLDYTIKRDADSPDIVWVDPFEKDPTQKVKNMKDAGATHKPHNVMVRVDGHPMYIFFNNNEGTLGHRTGLAINKANLVDPHGKLFRGMKWLVHLKASLVTRFNPSFILRNMIMDANNAFGLLATEGKIKDAKAFVKNYRPALAAVARWKRTGKFGNKTRADQLLEEAVYTGVLTGTYTNSTYSDNLINEIIKPIKRLQIQKGFGPKGSALDTFAYLGERTFELVGALSDIPEVGVRLATYMALRDNGWSKSDAAVYAREITVDFNKKGRYGPVFNTLYMFFNAGFQSAVRWLRAFKRGGVKQAAKAAAVYMLIGFASAWMNDDDDDWKNITDWEKQKSIIIPLPGDNYIRIPNRGVQSIFTYAGMKFYDMLNGYDTVSSGLMDILGGPGIDAFSVLGEGSGDLLQAVLPTAFDPIAQHATNTAYHGGTIYTQKFPNQTTPDSHMGRQNTNSAAVWIAQMLNALTFGDEVEEGGIDLYPETISHYVQFLFGGLGTEIAKLGDFVIDATQGEFSVKNLPVLSGVLNEVPNVERRYYEAASDFSDAYTKYRKYKELGNAQKASEVAKENVILKETNRLYALRQRVEKLRRLVKDAKKQGQEDLAEKYEKQMLELEEAFLKVYEGIKSK